MLFRPLFDLDFPTYSVIEAGKEMIAYLCENYPEFQELTDHAIETGEMPSYEILEMWYKVYRHDCLEVIDDV